MTSEHPAPASHPTSPPATRPASGVTRRSALLGLVGFAGATAVADVGLFAAPVHAAGLVPTFVLDPTIGGSCLSPGCSVCNACLNHASNKLFATLADAEAGRAHPNCRCVAVAGMSVSQFQFDQLFAAGPVADRRAPATGAVLASPPATVSAPGISGLVPTVVTLGGVATIVWIAARRHQLSNDR